MQIINFIIKKRKAEENEMNNKFIQYLLTLFCCSLKQIVKLMKRIPLLFLFFIVVVVVIVDKYFSSLKQINTNKKH